MAVTLRVERALLRQAEPGALLAAIDEVGRGARGVREETIEMVNDGLECVAMTRARQGHGLGCAGT
jgi:hypothetical protein